MIKEIFYTLSNIGLTNLMIGNHLVLVSKFHVERSMRMNKIIC